MTRQEIQTELNKIQKDLKLAINDLSSENQYHILIQTRKRLKRLVALCQEDTNDQ